MLLAGFSILRAPRSRLSWAGAIALLTVSFFDVASGPIPMKTVTTWDMVFLAVLPESKDPASDLIALGLDPSLAALSGKGAWAPGSVYLDLLSRGIIGKKVSILTIDRFYTTRPARLWRHISREIPGSVLMRPPLGNFDPSSGMSIGAHSSAFALWSDFHEHILARAARPLFFMLPVPALILLLKRISGRPILPHLQFFALLGLCAMTMFLGIIFVSPWETIKHMLIFNTLLDAFLICGALSLWSAAHSTVETWAVRQRTRDTEPQLLSPTSHILSTPGGTLFRT
jgi:hypothetical protein